MNTEMNDAVTPEVAAPVTYGDAVVDTPEYEVLHAEAVKAGVVKADERPSRLALIRNTWHVQQ